MFRDLPFIAVKAHQQMNIARVSQNLHLLENCFVTYFQLMTEISCV